MSPRIACNSGEVSLEQYTALASFSPLRYVWYHNEEIPTTRPTRRSMADAVVILEDYWKQAYLIFQREQYRRNNSVNLQP